MNVKYLFCFHLESPRIRSLAIKGVVETEDGAEARRYSI